MALFGKKVSRKQQQKADARKNSARATASANGVAHEIIHAPWFSEKALIVTEKGVYTFAVPTSATKATIAGAIKEIYKVTPKKIRIVNLPGKKKALRTRRGEGV